MPHSTLCTHRTRITLAQSHHTLPSHTRTTHAPNRSLTALVGLSGSGKSTLVALLLRLYDPTEGAVLWDGRDLRGLDAGWFRSQVGVVSQVRGGWSVRAGSWGTKGAWSGVCG